MISHQPKTYVCYRAAETVVIDGRLDRPVWQAADWTDDFVDIEGDIRPKPRFRTRVKMLWDDDFFYIGAELEEPHIWATLTEHDSIIFQDNDFEVFIDPDGDNHDYYEIEINALNTVWDLRLVKPYRDGGPALNSWEIPGLKTAVHIEGTLNDPADTDCRWSVEIALPWSVLAEFARCAAPPRHNDSWRVNFSRVEWDIEIKAGAYHKIPNRPEHNWVWTPQGVIDMHRPERWGYVQFSTESPGATPAVSDPTALARDLLMQVYYAQKAHKQAHGHWAESLSDLDTVFPVNDVLPHPPQYRVKGEHYVVSLECRLPDGTSQRLHVRHDSRLWIK